MQLVIDIPKDAYDFIKRTGYHTQSLHEAIKNGVPLPADHGRLIDMDAILKKYWNYPTGIGQKQIESMPTIVKATEDVEKGCWNCQNYVSFRCEVCGKDAKYWNLRKSEMKNDDVAISRQLRSMGELPKLQPHPPACEKRGLIK